MTTNQIRTLWAAPPGGGHREARRRLRQCAPLNGALPVPIHGP